MIDMSSRRESRRFDLGVTRDQAPGQTPAGMALSADRRRCSSPNRASTTSRSSTWTAARARTHPDGMVSDGCRLRGRATIDDDPRIKPQLFIVSAQGLGTQPDPGPNGTARTPASATSRRRAGALRAWSARSRATTTRRRAGHGAQRHPADQAFRLHRPREQALRRGVRRRTRGQRRIHNSDCTAQGSPPTRTRSPNATRCSTTSWATARRALRPCLDHARHGERLSRAQRAHA